MEVALVLCWLQVDKERILCGKEATWRSKIEPQHGASDVNWLDYYESLQHAIELIREIHEKSSVYFTCQPKSLESSKAYIFTWLLSKLVGEARLPGKCYHNQKIKTTTPLINLIGADISFNKHSSKACSQCKCVHGVHISLVRQDAHFTTTKWESWWYTYRPEF